MPIIGKSLLNFFILRVESEHHFPAQYSQKASKYKAYQKGKPAPNNPASFQFTLSISPDQNPNKKKPGKHHQRKDPGIIIMYKLKKREIKIYLISIRFKVGEIGISKIRQ